ncbi:SDR family oxidoreductase [uncultured Friedmanniella sp.]|uniref:SDR family oxidoreductase n=1 Tax=uncultured Friedmanniella sp. TaxID=335381 RepID=UPI0035CAE24F
MPATPPVRRQRILITGASAGLGAEMARAWAQDGRDLALCARRLGELERLRDELVVAYPDIRVSVHALDVDDHAAVDATFEEAASALGGLDRVVANAGVAQSGSLGLDDAEGNRATARTNFLGVLHQAEAALRIFRRAESGHLAVISSMSALRGMAGPMSVYAATKAGVSALAEGLHSDLWDSPITVTAVHPGYVSTSLATAFPQPIFMTSLPRATRAVVAAIEREAPRAYVPAWPWVALALPMRLLPLGVYRRIAG